MNNLDDPIKRLCDELSCPPPAADTEGAFEIEVEGNQVRFLPHHGGKVVLSVRMGNVAEMEEHLGAQAGDILLRCIRLHGARLGKLGLPYSLCLSSDSDDLLLWTVLETGSAMGDNFSVPLEELLNEVDYRRNWLGLTGNS